MDNKNKIVGQFIKRYPIHALAAAVLFVVLCASCNFPGSGADATETMPSIASTPTTESDVGETIKPTQQKVLLYAVKEYDDGAMRQLMGEIIELADNSGLVVESVNQIGEEDIQSDVSLVFAFEDDPGIVDFASRFVGTQFIGVGIPHITPSSNISLIGESGFQKDRQAFVAGYIAAMVAEDWRAGVVSIGYSEENTAIEEGFLNGARYFCGLCRPAFPPFYEYPQAMHFDPNGQGWESVVGLIRENKLGVIYLAPIGGFESSGSEWPQIDSAIIGDGPRPEIVPESQWMAGVQFTVLDELQNIWNDLLAGKGGFQIQWELQIVDVNSDLLSPGKEQQAAALIEDLVAGFVDTGIELQGK